MKRFYVILMLAIAIALAVGVGISEHTGYVLITYPHVLNYESSVWATLVAVFAIGLAICLIRVLLSLITTSGGLVNPWSRRNRSRRVQIAIEQGQMDLAEGRWASAERHLHRAAEAERQPLLYYLGAAHKRSTASFSHGMRGWRPVISGPLLTHFLHQTRTGTGSGDASKRLSSNPRPSWNSWLLRSVSPSCANKRANSAQASGLRCTCRLPSR